MAWRRSGDKPLSETRMESLLTHIYASVGLNELTLLMLRLEYHGRTMSIPKLLMTWLLALPGHQQQWHWQYKMGIISTTWNILMSMNEKKYDYIWCLQISSTHKGLKKKKSEKIKLLLSSPKAYCPWGNSLLPKAIDSVNNTSNAGGRKYKYTRPPIPSQPPTQKVFFQWHTQYDPTMKHSHCETVYAKELFQWLFFELVHSLPLFSILPTFKAAGLTKECQWCT